MFSEVTEQGLAFGIIFDVAVVYVLGVVAFFMRRYGFPIAPTILAVVLGPMLEQQFRRAMAISGGDPTVFVTRPLTAAILAVAVAAVSAPVLARYVAARRRQV